jgi:hypothetical protein
LPISDRMSVSIRALFKARIPATFPLAACGRRRQRSRPSRQQNPGTARGTNPRRARAGRGRPCHGGPTRIIGTKEVIVRHSKLAPLTIRLDRGAGSLPADATGSDSTHVESSWPWVRRARSHAGRSAQSADTIEGMRDGRFRKMEIKAKSFDRTY